MPDHLDEKTREKIRLAWVHENLTTEEIGRKFGVSSGYARNAARRIGWGKRLNYKPRTVTPKHWTPTKMADAQQYLLDGHSATEAAQLLGKPFTRNMVSGMAVRMGWKRTSQEDDRQRRRATTEKSEGRKRASAPPTVPAISTAIRARPWQPLEGSSPVDLFSRCGCKWPVDGGTSQLFCNLPIHESDQNGWCETHIGMGRMADRLRSSARDLERLIRRAR